MKKTIKKKESHDNVERWMVSYADFLTLLFCFFTAMFAISNVDTHKLGKFVDSMRQAFHSAGVPANGISVIDGVHVFVPSDAEIESQIKEMLDSLIRDLNGVVSVYRDKRGVTISVEDKIFFKTGFATLKEDARKVLDKVAAVLQQFPNKIRIEGHTDNIPVQSGRFPSNWELSATRAISVAKYFVDNHDINPWRISTIGYAEFRPVASNDRPEGRAKNRRVDIVLLNKLESNKEPL